MQENQVINQVWAYLFSQGKTEKVMRAADGGTLMVGLSQQDVGRIVRSLLNPSVNKLMSAYDWPFAYAEATDATVVDQAAYTLSGDNDDCRDIINIRVGDDEDVLDKLNVLENDRRKPSKDGTGVYGWTEYGESDDGFPVIYFHNTPTSVETFKYRYRKKDLSLADWPDRYDYVMTDEVIGRLDPTMIVVAENSLSQMLSNYKIGGDEYQTIRRDPVIEAGNVRRAGLQGGA